MLDDGFHRVIDVFHLHVLVWDDLWIEEVPYKIHRDWLALGETAPPAMVIQFAIVLVELWQVNFNIF